MQITKFGHACIRVEHGGATLVVDPGVFTAPAAVDGADAILITHEHPDHFAPALLERAAAKVFTIASVSSLLPEGIQSTVVAPGQNVLVDGFSITVVGEMHAVTHPDSPRLFNSGYVIDAGGTAVYHPGDSLTPPPVQVDVCCVPVSGPWLKLSDAIDFVRSVKAPVNLGIHDRLASESGLELVASQMGNLLPAGLSFVRQADGHHL